MITSRNNRYIYICDCTRDWVIFIYFKLAVAQAKELGTQTVPGFDPLWDSKKDGVMYTGCFAKFSVPELRQR